jgi:hypothetical protein
MWSKLIGIAVAIAAIYGVVVLFDYFKTFQRTESRTGENLGFVTTDPLGGGGGSAGSTAPATTVGDIPPEALAGLRPEFEAGLATAYKGGAVELGKWLKRFGPYTADPRRAAIELDYASLLIRTDSVNAKKIYAAVARRTPADSPIYPRVKRLENVYK